MSMVRIVSEKRETWMGCPRRRGLEVSGLTMEYDVVDAD